MSLKYQVGQKIPSISLRDDRDKEVSIAEVAGGSR